MATATGAPSSVLEAKLGSGTAKVGKIGGRAGTSWLSARLPKRLRAQLKSEQETPSQASRSVVTR